MSRSLSTAISTLAITSALAVGATAGEPEAGQQAILKTIATMTSSFAAGDVDDVLATYEEGAVVVSAPGQPVKGRDELAAMFGQFIEAGIDFDYGAHDVVIAGDIGLHLMKWTTETPDGKQSALSVAVLRRQSDGNWRMVIDHPFGDHVMLDGK